MFLFLKNAEFSLICPKIYLILASVLYYKYEYIHNLYLTKFISAFPHLLKYIFAI